MDYKDLAELYSKLEKTSKRLEKTFLISKFLLDVPENSLKDIVYLLQGKVFAHSDERKIGMSSKLILKAIAASAGESPHTVESLWKSEGDLGLVAEKLLSKKKQATLFSRKLTAQKVIENIRKLSELSGEGTVGKKVGIISELLNMATPKEAKYIVKTVLEEMRTGVQDSTLRDSYVLAFLPKVKGVFYYCKSCKAYSPEENCLNCGKETSESESKEVKSIDELRKYDAKDFVSSEDPRKLYNEIVDRVQHALDMSGDSGEVALSLRKSGFAGIGGAKIKVGRPIKAMLFEKAKNIEEAFETVGKPVIAEPKLDGFRLQIHSDNGEVMLFTRRLENVTIQFPDVVKAVKECVKSKTFILDSEAVGIDPEKKTVVPFQNISQRIKRKYDLAKTIKELPVKVIVFDAMMISGESLLDTPFNERRKRLESIVKKKKDVFEVIGQCISSSEKEVERFYKKALASGMEGIMIKKVDGLYQPGRRVGVGVKLKPTMENLDLTIVAAEWGEGKRKNWLSSFTLACKGKDGLLEIGKVGTGIKEKLGEGVSFEELTKELKPLIKEEKGREVRITPKVVVEVMYEEIQKSTNYSSGYALRFPRVVRIRTMEKSIKDINTLNDVERLYRQQK